MILGCAQPNGAAGQQRRARRRSSAPGLPVSVAGTTVNRFCSSGLQAIAMAAHQIIQDGAEAAIGGGVEIITHDEARRRPEPVGEGAASPASTW